MTATTSTDLDNVHLAHGCASGSLEPYRGICLVVEPVSLDAALERARAYAKAQTDDVFVHRVTVSGLFVVHDVDVDVREALDGEGFPGDTTAELDRYESLGFDALRFRDADPTGREHTTIRLVSRRAVEAATSIEVLTADDF